MFQSVSKQKLLKGCLQRLEFKSLADSTSQCSVAPSSFKLIHLVLYSSIKAPANVIVFMNSKTPFFIHSFHVLALACEQEK